METIEFIPVALNPVEIAVRLRFDPKRTGSDNLSELIDIGQTLLKPRAVYEIAYTGQKEEATVEVSGAIFHSAVLRRNLNEANKVFPYIITVGPELERAAAEQGDLLRQFYLEEIANLALEQAAAWLSARLEERHGLGPLSSMSPGSLEDWPITEQPKLFSIFGDTERLVGVRLTDSMLMLPRKSISGILFPSEEGFIACQLCERERCPGRQAPFKPKA
jgi:hypothetical protein